jgi:hypothetical protein
MTTTDTTNTTGEPRSDADIESSIEAKIQEAIAKAVEDGVISGDEQIVVAVDPSTGEIHVGERPVPAAETPDPVEFPAAYADDHDSLVDHDGMKDHFESHWGF